MEPVIGNSLSNTCDAPISSNCVAWAGDAIPGICKGATLTQVVQKVSENSTCCDASFPPGHMSGYTGNWVDYSGGIPTSGSIWSISTFGLDGSNNPSYRWTREGDLSIRGSFLLKLTPGGGSGSIQVPLVNIPVVNMPTNWTANQVIRVGTSAITIGNGQGQLFLEFPTGTLYFMYFFNFTGNPPVSQSIGVGFGGVRFNLA